MSQENPSPQDPSLRAGNITTDKIFDVSEYADLLLKDEQFNTLDEIQRADAIGDRIIGAIVANGEVKGSKGAYSPADILTLFDAARTARTVEDLNKVASAITNTAGLRRTFLLFASNNMGGLFGQLRERAGLGAYSKGLGSMDMLDGYLHAAQQRYKDSHLTSSEIFSSVSRPIEDEMERYVGLSDNHTDTFCDTMVALSHSDVPSLWRKGDEARRTLESAKNMGIDEDTLNNTGNRLRYHKRIGADIGTKAMRYTVNDIDKFFQ